jgi:tetratricopeptide (TPR) repeat protein
MNYTNVKRMFEEALLFDPRHGPAYNAYGNVELRRGNVEGARRIFERGVRAVCSDPASLYHGYGKLELSLGNVETAREIFLKGLKEVRRIDVGMDSPHRERAKYLVHTLGMLELKCNRPADAMEVFQEGIERCGNSSQLLLGAALCQVKLGKDFAATALFERSVLSDKKHAQAWQAWGVMETRAGNFPTATTLFQAGIKSAPKHGALWHAYASMELRRGHIQNSRLLFAKGIKKCPGHTPLYQGWAFLELREGNHEAAKTLIAQALTRDKRNGSGWLIASEIEKALGNEGLASLLLRRGIECAPNEADLYLTLGNDLLVQGKIVDAREVFEKGLEVNPLFAPLYHSLAELEAKVFNLEGLSKLNKRAAQVFPKDAVESSKESSKAWGTKIRANSRILPSGVAALARKIADDDGDTTPLLEGEMDDLISDFLDSMTADLMEDELVNDLLGADSMISQNQTLQ